VTVLLARETVQKFLQTVEKMLSPQSLARKRAREANDYERLTSKEQLLGPKSIFFNELN
jgi:hypothetical protein